MLKQIAKWGARRAGVTVSRAAPEELRIFNGLGAARRASDLPIPEVERAFLQHCLAWAHLSKSQIFQDLFVDFVMKGRSGVVCEFGATDGVALSNSHFLESARGWKALLAEPGLNWREALLRNRPDAIVDFRCVYSATGERLQFNEVSFGELSTIASYSDTDAHRGARKQGRVYEVETISLNDLLRAHQITKVDYLSVDTEGSEFEILERFDFAAFQPDVVTVEHNFTPNRERLFGLLTGAGYRRVLEKYSQFDDWYVRPALWQA